MKKRIDVLLYEKGLAPSREKARTLIMAGCVYADNQKFDKPGDTVREDAVLEVRGNTLRYVSRSTYYTELIQTDERNFYDIVDSKFMQSRN